MYRLCAYGRKSIRRVLEPTAGHSSEKRGFYGLGYQGCEEAGEIDACYLREIQVRYWHGFFIVGRIKGWNVRFNVNASIINSRGYDMLDLGANAEKYTRALASICCDGVYYATGKIFERVKATRGSVNNGTLEAKMRRSFAQGNLPIVLLWG